MQDKQLFVPEKISMLEFKMLKGQVEAAESFDADSVLKHQVKSTLELGFNITDKLVKADFTIAITADSEGLEKSSVTGNFHFVFVYKVDNLDELAIVGKNNMVDLDGALGNALSSITYSTSRGILLTRLQGTALQNFILPVINPNNLFNDK